MMAFISHLGSVIKFDISTAPEQNRGRSSDDTLTASSFKFSPDTRGFEPTGRSEGLPLPCPCRNHCIIKVKCVLDEGTSNVLPCIVVQSQSEASHGRFLNSIVFYIPQSHKLFIYSRFSSDVPLCTDTLWLTDGPTVYWIDLRNIMCGRKGRNFDFGAQPIPSMNGEACHGRKMKHCWIDRSQISHLILGRSSTENPIENDGDESAESDESDDSDMGWLEFRSRIKLPGKTSVRLDVLHKISLFPSVYNPITLCIQSTLADNVSKPGHLAQQGTSNSSVAPDTPDAYDETEKNVTVIATSMKQLLEFRDGELCQMVWIPFDDAASLVAMEIGGERMFAVQSQGGRVCLVRDSSFQVFKEWSNVASIHVDSFLANGQDQLLLLLNTSKTSSSSSPFPDFVLTDLGLCLITSDPLLHDGKDKVRGQGVTASQTSQCPKNLLTTVQALQSRVEQGVTALKEQEVGCRQKERMIQQSVQALQHMAAGESVPSHIQPTFVHLCGNATQGGKASTTPPTSSDITRRLKISDAWQRVIDEKWVIGCKVTNQSQWPVSDLCLWLLPVVTASQQEAIQSEGCIHHPSSSSRISKDNGASMLDEQQPPPAKMIKLDTAFNPWSSGRDAQKSASFQKRLEPGRTADAVATTIVPDFQAGPVFSCHLAVQWTTYHEVDYDDDDGQAKVRSQVCGSVVLNASDVGGDKLGIQMPHAGNDPVDVLSRVDELALNATQSTSHLIATSRYTQLSCLPGVLSEMGFHMSSGMCLEGALQRTRVFADGLQQKCAHITVCAKDERQLMLFRHTLISRLPDDVTISTVTPKQQMEDAITSGISRISIELEHTHQMFEWATFTPGVEVPTESGPVKEEGAMKGEEKERIERLRRDFQSESCSRAGHYAMSEDKAVQLRKMLIVLKYKTDSAIATLSEVVSAS